jgi:hypothetical protein
MPRFVLKYGAFLYFALKIKVMKINQFAFVLLFLCTISVVVAQPIRTTAVKNWNLEAVRFNASYHIQSPYLTDFTTIRKLAMDQNELTEVPDIASFNKQSNSQQGNLGNLIVQVSALYSPKSKKDPSVINRRRMLQVGLSYQDMATFESAYFKTEPVDTFKYLSKTREYFVNARASILQFEGAYLFTTDPDRAAYLYGGAGVNLGFSLSSLMQENTSETLLYNAPDSTYNELTVLGKDIKSKGYLVAAFAIPFGFHARIHKNWGAVADFRYNLMLVNNSGAGSFVRSGLQLGLGLKYTFGSFPDKKEEEEEL